MPNRQAAAPTPEGHMDTPAIVPVPGAAASNQAAVSPGAVGDKAVVVRMVVVGKWAVAMAPVAAAGDRNQVAQAPVTAAEDRVTAWSRQAAVEIVVPHLVVCSYTHPTWDILHNSSLFVCYEMSWRSLVLARQI